MLNLVRLYENSNYIIGKLYLNDSYVCDTLEPSSVASHPCIPCGVYHVAMRDSYKFGRSMPFILDPPSLRSGILFHSGNSVKDTKGCILVGYNDIVGGLSSSKRAFAWLSAYVSCFVDPSMPVILSIKNKFK